MDTRDETDDLYPEDQREESRTERAVGLALAIGLLGILLAVDAARALMSQRFRI